MLTYFIFPFDLIPDFLLLFGLIDDVVITSFVFERLVKIAPEALKEKYELTSTSNLRKD
ncbi:YkvA family protein [Virgibacillus halodenitrificans]|uniref:YkvA family protein n=1 Tax=Virgibacillus halodenitrificans TaxID=1482 RepID=UPI0030B8C8FE